MTIGVFFRPAVPRVLRFPPPSAVAHRTTHFSSSPTCSSPTRDAYITRSSVYKATGAAMLLPRPQLLRARRVATAMSCRRTLTTTSPLQTNYGFIGLGRMGFPMARNLRSKIPKEDKLVVFDVNETATKEFLGVFNAGMEILDVGETTVAKDVRDVAEKSVCAQYVFSHHSPRLQDEHSFSFSYLNDLSWGYFL